MDEPALHSRALSLEEIRAIRTATSVALEVFVEDVETFVDLLPDHWFRDDAPVRDHEAERWRRFAHEGLQITAVEDHTPIPHNGCRPRKKRRV